MSTDIEKVSMMVVYRRKNVYFICHGMFGFAFA